MTTENRELFELCKQVYEATGWKQSQNISQLYEYWDDHDELCVISIEDADDALVPAYTSDYLLEELSVVTDHVSVTRSNKISIDASNDEKSNWYANCWFRSRRVQVKSDTPLKALLKLTLKLYEEGLLNE